MKNLPHRLSVSLLLLAWGCQGAPGSRITDEHFFPRAPEPPRVQFLRSFNGSADFSQGSEVLDYLAGAEKPKEYELQKPFSVASWKGKIYATDSFGLQKLTVFDLEKRTFYVLGLQEGPGQLKKPIHVFVDERGYKYVSDTIRKQVVVFGPDESFVRTYGDGKSFVPVACVARGKEVYVLDADFDKEKSEDTEEITRVRRDQIVVLDKSNGQALRRIGRHEKGEKGFCFASFLSVDRLGYLYVSDTQNHRVVKIDPRGNVLLTFGIHGDQPGEFASMKGIAIDPRGLIYVVDAAFQAVQVFDAAGSPLFGMGGVQGSVAPMDLPAGIWIDRYNLEYFRDYYAPDFTPEYLVLVANQLSRENRIAVYAYGKRKGTEYPSEDDIKTLEMANSKALWRLDVTKLGPAAAAQNAPSVKSSPPAKNAPPARPTKEKQTAPSPARKKRRGGSRALQRNRRASTRWGRAPPCPNLVGERGGTRSHAVPPTQNAR